MNRSQHLKTLLVILIVGLTHDAFAQCKAQFSLRESRDGAVTFYSRSTNAHHYTWDFGDGTTSTLKTPKHKYKDLYKGHKICLYISDSTKSCFDTTCVIYRGPNCGANFSAKIMSDGKVEFQPGYSRPTGVSYSWNFGDGKKATSAHPNRGVTHQYDTSNLPDTVIVCLDVYDSLNGCKSSKCEKVFIANSRCSASFTAKTSLDTLFLEATGSITKDKFYSWTVNKTTRLSGAKRHYRIGKKGRFEVCLEVLDRKTQCVARVCDSVTVDSVTQCAVKADFTFDINQVSRTGRFKSTSSANAHVLRWYAEGPGQWSKEQWRYGDPTDPKQEVFKFPEPGQYVITLSVHDSTIGGCYDTISTTIEIKSCHAAFDVVKDSSKKFVLKLLNKSSNGSGHTYSWTFGDGGTSTKRNPRHDYKTFGKFEVCLTVSDKNSRCVSTYCDSLGLDSTGRLLKNAGFSLISEDDANLSIQNLNKGVTHKIYPNPTSGKVKVELNEDVQPNADIRILNLQGKEVHMSMFDKSNVLDLDVSELSPGIYLIQVFNGDSFSQTKLMKLE